MNTTPSAAHRGITWDELSSSIPQVKDLWGIDR